MNILQAGNQIWLSDLNFLSKILTYKQMSRITQSVTPLNIGLASQPNYESSIGKSPRLKLLPESTHGGIPSPKPPDLLSPRPMNPPLTPLMRKTSISKSQFHSPKPTLDQMRDSNQIEAESPQPQSVRLDLLSLSPYALRPKSKSHQPISEFCPCSPRGKEPVLNASVWNSTAYKPPKKHLQRPPDLNHLMNSSLPEMCWTASLRSPLSPRPSFCEND
ncbi:hypothetical protein GEMRC1_003633 [Eukaryota sp. GEM-RC1]